MKKKFWGIHWSKMPNRKEILDRMKVSKTGKKHSLEHNEKIKQTFLRLGIKPPLNSRKKSLEERKKISRAKILYYDKIGRVTELKKYLRFCPKYNEWRKCIFERDNFTCQICQSYGVELNADHIISFANIIQDFKKETGLLGEELRIALLGYKPLWDIDNGRTLCVYCHRKTETYGKNLK